MYYVYNMGNFTSSNLQFPQKLGLQAALRHTQYTRIVPKTYMDTFFLRGHFVTFVRRKNFGSQSKMQVNVLKR